MIKRLAFLAVALASALPALAHAVERGEAKATVAGKKVIIDYGRPSLKGRDMLAQAEVGKSWRMGADAATTLKTEADLKFGEVAVPKGDYVLKATKLAADKWELNFSKEDGASVAAVPLTPQKLSDSVETFTIELTGGEAAGEFVMKWGGTGLKTPFTAK
jgi:Protein of unknown function (DUF2911)